MGRVSSRGSHTRRIRLRRDFHGELEWRCISEWDVYYPGDRLRYPRSRITRYSNERDARRWARRYGVECPTEPEN